MTLELFKKNLQFEFMKEISGSLQVDLCGHATLASAHILFSNGLVDSEIVEFDTRSGILTAKRVPLKASELNDGEEESTTMLIELNFPVVPTYEFNSTDDLSVLSKALNGATIVDIKATKRDLLVNISPTVSMFLFLLVLAIETKSELFSIDCRLCFRPGNL